VGVCLIPISLCYKLKIILPFQNSLFWQALSQWGQSKKWASDKRGLPSPFLSPILLIADPAHCLPAFLIVPTDGELGTGYSQSNRNALTHICHIVHGVHCVCDQLPHTWIIYFIINVWKTAGGRHYSFSL